MPRKLGQGEKRARPADVKTETCPTCSQEMPLGRVHCNGSQVAYGCQMLEPHHGLQLWTACWGCHRPMGCLSCVPGGFRRHYQGPWLNADLVCTACRVKVTLESFLNGGPISRFSLSFAWDERRIGWHEAHGVPGVSAYPRPWVAAYANQRAAAGLSLDDDEQPEFRGLLGKLSKMLAAEPMAIPSRRQLQRERNKQVDKLAAAGEITKRIE